MMWLAMPLRQATNGTGALTDGHHQPRLIGEENVPPLHQYNASGRSPFLLTADHYGRLLPPALGDLGLPEPELSRHIAWDIGIAGVAERLATLLDAHLIAQRYSRLGVDRNRPPGQARPAPVSH